MANILMPKATAVWLVDNTSLTFEQIAAFCELHPLEVKGIADDEVAKDIRGVDPVARGELTRSEIEKGESNSEYRLKVPAPKYDVAPPKRKGARYTPVSRRGDRPDAIQWFIRHHPEISDAQISKLIGTTKSTIELVRTRQHWNSANIKPVDPVTLGLTTQIELDSVVSKASAKRAKMDAERAERSEGPGLEPVKTPDQDATIDAETAAAAEEEATRQRQENLTVDDVFANFSKPEDGGDA